ncbi:hypothetical protein PSI23_21100 [Xenorhabdus sp. XENO-10]|uniref:Uncharacterized protein n=1 Tax=Xenorhabdus yunnanensis TaxID=3025878 RepID=A0ABT5LMF6_9GAMM|nr:hypothetical protein [Xenorhabdus yunnanensis]MDC9591708.1 hypothetical protein [Xenorhabdus yunnanensis]
MTKDNKDSIEIVHRRAVRKFNEFYSAIFGEISSMLKKAKLLPIPELQRNNPTFSDTVSVLKLYRDFSNLAADLLKIDKKNCFERTK